MNYVKVVYSENVNRETGKKTYRCGYAHYTEDGVEEFWIEGKQEKLCAPGDVIKKLGKEYEVAEVKKQAPKKYKERYCTGMSLIDDNHFKKKKIA